MVKEAPRWLLIFTHEAFQLQGEWHLSQSDSKVERASLGLWSSTVSNNPSNFSHCRRPEHMGHLSILTHMTIGTGTCLPHGLGSTFKQPLYYWILPTASSREHQYCLFSFCRCGNRSADQLTLPRSQARWFGGLILKAGLLARCPGRFALLHASGNSLFSGKPPWLWSCWKPVLKSCQKILSAFYQRGFGGGRRKVVSCTEQMSHCFRIEEAKIVSWGLFRRRMSFLTLKTNKQGEGGKQTSSFYFPFFLLRYILIIFPTCPSSY